MFCSPEARGPEELQKLYIRYIIRYIESGGADDRATECTKADTSAAETGPSAIF